MFEFDKELAEILTKLKFSTPEEYVNIFMNIVLAHKKYSQQPK
jgi:hypothetical protein